MTLFILWDGVLVRDIISDAGANPRANTVVFTADNIADEHAIPENEQCHPLPGTRLSFPAGS